jgi:hypothetical protein
VLADGTRALTTAGRWTEAARHITERDGIGQRLLDGRQVLILAHGIARDHQAARDALRDSNALTPWEQAVAACLQVFLCGLAGEPADGETSAMARAYRRPWTAVASRLAADPAVEAHLGKRRPWAGSVGPPFRHGHHARRDQVKSGERQPGELV